MRYSAENPKLSYVELTYFLIALVLVLLLGALVKGQTAPHYRDYRGVRLGMTATEVRAKLGDPVMKSNEQDYYIVSPNETTQVVYDAFQKVVTISTDYTGGVGAPDSTAVVGAGAMLQRPDGSLFRMVQFESEGVWVSYNKSASAVPVVTVTIQLIKKS